MVSNKKEKALKITIKEGVIVDVKKRKCPIKSWIPAKPKLQLYLIHGLAEHIGCYTAFAESLCAKGIAVHAVDLIGHGNANGVRGHIYHFLEFIDLITLFHQKNPFTIKNTPEFMMGHSTGGLIAGLYAAERNPVSLQGLILNNPLLGFDPLHSAPLKLYAKILAKKDPTMLIPKPIGHEGLTRKLESIQFLREDPLRVRVITPKLFLQMLEWSAVLQKEAKQITLPLLAFLSHHDTVVYPHKTIKFIKSCASEDKNMMVFGNAKHEMIQDIEVDNLINILDSWLKKHI